MEAEVLSLDYLEMVEKLGGRVHIFKNTDRADDLNPRFLSTANVGYFAVLVEDYNTRLGAFRFKFGGLDLEELPEPELVMQDVERVKFNSKNMSIVFHNRSTQYNFERKDYLTVDQFRRIITMEKLVSI